jgi:murein DD-endopeptidase MepM/ murein hydrolase activator NlpD
LWQKVLLGVTSHFKTRHLLTRHDRLRLRYVATAAAAIVFAASFYVGGTIGPSQQVETSAEYAANVEPAAGLSTAAPIFSVFSGNFLDGHRDQTGQIRRDPTVKESVLLAEGSDDADSPAAEERRIEIGKGDTLAGVLMRNGLVAGEAQTVVNAVSRHFNMRALRPGLVLHMTLEPADTESGYQLAGMTFSPDPLRTIDVVRDAGGSIVANLDEKVIKATREARQVVIDGSVYGSADKANLPDRIAANTIKLFSYAVDFQRDIHAGDRLDVLYDSYKTADGYVARTGDIAYARLKVGGREYALYRYEDKDGQVDYYTSDGKSIRKSAGLMRTPVAFGRMSSGFGVRTHPVLGYTKMHKGVDFAAPTGTAVYASGDGVIERAGRFSTFGNYVRVRHSSKLSTAYAHLSRYGKGIRPGVRIKQGQIIGYVGTTGRSTGPHLHYEVLVNNVQVNPKSVKFAADNSLKGRELARFKDTIKSLGNEYAQKLGSSVKLASAE